MRYLFICFCCLILVGCKSEVFEIPVPNPTPIDTTGTPGDSTTITYQNKVKQIIDVNCVGCHDQNSANGNFSTYPSLKPYLDNGKFENRVLIQKNMPPSGPLPQNILTDLQAWLDNNYPEN